MIRTLFGLREGERAWEESCARRRLLHRKDVEGVRNDLMVVRGPAGQWSLQERDHPSSHSPFNSPSSRSDLRVQSLSPVLLLRDPSLASPSVIDRFRRLNLDDDGAQVVSLFMSTIPPNFLPGFHPLSFILRHSSLTKPLAYFQ